MSILRPLAIALPLMLSTVSAQAVPLSTFTETTLVTNLTDPNLVNPWGISSSASGPFWISDNATGLSTLYNTAGVKQGLVVSMPAGSENVTGQVFNGTPSFHGDVFLFATENGTIAGWRGALGTSAETLFTLAGANYKGLAVSGAKDTLYAANFAAGQIDVYSSSGLIGSFTDPTMPAGYAPFNIQNINGRLYVTFALRGAAGDDLAGAGHGFVAVFDPVTHTFTRLVTQGVLNSPWGLAIAPLGFGALGGDLLVGNFGDGSINVFDALSGGLLGTLSDAKGDPLLNDGLWGLAFGNGGLLTSLYITAGPDGETGGLFARIDSTQIPEPAGAWLLGLGFVILALLHHKQSRCSPIHNA